MNTGRRMINQIKKHFDAQPSAALREIIESQDRQTWSDCAFAAAAEVLKERIEGKASEPPSVEISPGLLSASNVAVTNPEVVWSSPRFGNVDLCAEPRRWFESSHAAKEMLRRFQMEIPKVLSSYQPSGVIPNGCTNALACASLQGAFLGCFAAIVAALLTVTLLFVPVWLERLMQNGFTGLVACPLIVVMMAAYVFGFLIALAIYPLIGFASLYTVGNASSRILNRNATVSALAAFTSSLMAVLLFWGVASLPPLQEMRTQWLSSQQEKEVNMDNRLGRKAALGKFVYVDGFYVLQFIGAVSAITLAVWGVWQDVGSSKVCESCECHMKETRLLSMTAGSAIAIVDCVANDNIESLCGLLPKIQKGSSCRLMIYACPTCVAGFLDVVFRFRGDFKRRGKNGSDHLDAEWLIASCRLTADDVQVISQGVSSTTVSCEMNREVSNDS